MAETQSIEYVEAVKEIGKLKACVAGLEKSFASSAAEQQRHIEAMEAENKKLIIDIRDHHRHCETCIATESELIGLRAENKLLLLEIERLKAVVANQHGALKRATVAKNEARNELLGPRDERPVRVHLGEFHADFITEIDQQP